MGKPGRPFLMQKKPAADQKSADQQGDQKFQQFFYCGHGMSSLL
jgi:hypothetical protein